MRDGPPRSLAIAGAWGYIGQKFLRAGRSLGVTLYAFDPGEPPAAMELQDVRRARTESEFYALPAELFHLAVHPEHRGRPFQLLLERGRREPIAILCEKPMAAPERPEDCWSLRDDIRRAGAAVLYDFPELYDPLYRRILEFLRGFQRVRIDAIELLRAKDREDPANPRNRKRMVSIQYQESVHCWAFALHLLATSAGGIDALLSQGLTVEGTSRPYQPPNPEAYPHVVDGYCEYRATWGPTSVRGCTNFLRGAPWAKRRVVRGVGDGRPFTIVADFLEGAKRLWINEELQRDALRTDSYEEVLKTCGDWRRRLSPADLAEGLYPNPHFAHVTYQLSSMLWRSCRDQRPIRRTSLEDVLAFDAGFARAIPTLERYA